MSISTRTILKQRLRNKLPPQYDKSIIRSLNKGGKKYQSCLFVQPNKPTYLSYDIYNEKHIYYEYPYNTQSVGFILVSKLNERITINNIIRIKGQGKTYQGPIMNFNEENRDFTYESIVLNPRETKTYLDFKCSYSSKKYEIIPTFFEKQIIGLNMSSKNYSLKIPHFSFNTTNKTVLIVFYKKNKKLKAEVIPSE